MYIVLNASLKNRTNYGGPFLLYISLIPRFHLACILKAISTGVGFNLGLGPRLFHDNRETMKLSLGTRLRF